MKLAMAQIDMRLGDIPGICSRIEEQAHLARRQGATMLITPAPLLMGIMPGALVDAPNFQHQMLSALQDLSVSRALHGISCLIPMVVPVGEGSVFEVALLRDGHVSPMRLAFMKFKEGSPFAPWTPPVFDIGDIRIAVTFDLARDIEDIPPGCDLILSFQVGGLNIIDPTSSGVAGMSESGFPDLAREHRVWIAHMMPIGGFDGAAYTGGSFLLDEMGQVVAAAPCFEEGLLVHEVQRGLPSEPLDEHLLPHFDRREWLWEALRLHLRDTVLASGTGRGVVHLRGDLPSSLVAALAVDALGPRNVIGVHMGNEGARTPAEEAAESRRSAHVREIASTLHIRLVERTVEGAAELPDRDTPEQRASSRRLREGTEGLCLEDTAAELGAFPISALTKTDYALAVGNGALTGFGMIAPFGDVYLTELEFLARYRNRISAVLPPFVLGLAAVREAMGELLDRAVEGSYRDPAYADRVGGLLRSLEPSEVDAALEGHVDRGLALEEVPHADDGNAPVAMLFLLVRRGEAKRRRMPSYPIVSARSFSELLWPEQLAWSDLGRRGAEALTADELADAAVERYQESSEGEMGRMRREIIGLIGGMMGMSSEQVDSIATEGSEERIAQEFQHLQERLRGSQRRRDGGSTDASDLLDGIMDSRTTYPFFSRN